MGQKWSTGLQSHNVPGGTCRHAVCKIPEASVTWCGSAGILHQIWAQHYIGSTNASPERSNKH